MKRPAAAGPGPVLPVPLMRGGREVYVCPYRGCLQPAVTGYRDGSRELSAWVPHKPGCPALARLAALALARIQPAA